MAQPPDEERPVAERIQERLEEAFRQIARDLDVPIDFIIRTAARLVRKHRNPAAARLEAVRQLRNAGLSNREIAKRLDVSRSYVASLAGQLIRAGQIAPRPKGNWLDPAIRTARQQAILAARQGVQPYRAIAEQLGCSVSLVAAIAQSLVREGKLPKHLYGGRSRFNWRDLQDVRTQLVIRLRSEGATLKEIGTALGVTKQQTWNIVRKLLELHGEAIVGQPRRTKSELARTLGVSSLTIAQTCSELGIVISKRRHGLTGEQIEAIKAVIESNRGSCVICGQPLPFGRVGRWRRVLCGNRDCKRAHDRQKRAEWLAKPLSEVRLGDWHQELVARLQGHQIPADDEWLTDKKAAAAAGITKMQFFLLRARRILTVRPHPTVKSYRRNGNPAYTYARSELELVREVYAAHRRDVVP